MQYDYVKRETESVPYPAGKDTQWFKYDKSVQVSSRSLQEITYFPHAESARRVEVMVEWATGFTQDTERVHLQPNINGPFLNLTKQVLLLNVTKHNRTFLTI